MNPFMTTGTSHGASGQSAEPGPSTGARPGGSETVGPAGTKGQIGILKGRVTTMTATAARSAARATASVATAPNPIVLENAQTGNPESEWGIDGAGDANIEGFATDISVNRGTTIGFKINTDSTDYRIDIYRLGYYGGMGARKVETILHSGLQVQPAPLEDAATGLVDAGNWAVSQSWPVPSDAVSGVYVAKLVRQDETTGENHIPFVVRDDSSHSDIVFQTADTTWHAYNGWGGANFYGGNGPATGQGNGRAFALSYNRPIDTRGGTGFAAGPQDYLFGAEYAAIFWLEQNGYDVSYMTGVDVDRHGSLLLNHKAYVDTGHDEYWSGPQRANVAAARDAGVNLAFWSGNEMYWRVRWGNSISSDATAYRTMICYKETWANASIDPSDQWTGTFRDPRFSPPAIGGGSPENAVTGTLFQVDDVGVVSGVNLGAIEIPYSKAGLRFWRNTTVADLQPGQTATLIKNYLGYEWDEVPDNGFDPAGLIRLSSTTLAVSSYLLDYGNNTGNATATHSLTLYRAPSGALVFGAGTVYWSWGLSDNHDLQETATDKRVQQAMINMFADMNIQPATLQSDLIESTPSTDHTAPTSTIDALGPVAAGSLVTISGTAADVGGVVAGVEVSTDNGVSWFTATGTTTWSYVWSPQVAGTFTILSRAADDSLNLETPSAGRSVTVTPRTFLALFPGSATPAVVNTTDTSPVELGVRFQTSAAGQATGIRFYKSSQDTGTHTGHLWSNTGTLLASTTFSNETPSGWQSATFATPVTLTPGTLYVASYHTNASHYSNTPEYFTTNVVAGPLTAPAAGNGVFAYGSTSQFPGDSFQSTNFWVDVMFNPATPQVNHAPVAQNDSGPAVTRDTPVVIAAATLLANDSDPDGDALTITAVGAASHGTVTLNVQSNPQNNTVTFTPEAGYTGPAGFDYTISDGNGATATATVDLEVFAPGTAPVSLFTAAATPSASFSDGTPLEVGVKFTSSTAGQVTALKFYRSATDTGPNVLDLWDASGVNLASVPFSNTTAAGWQTVTLPTPVSISANTTYIASYHTTGVYVATNGYFSSAVSSGPLTAPSSASSGGNGVFTYGGSNSTGIFPTSTFDAANYFADIVFVTSASANPPTAVADTADATEKGGTANSTAGSPASGNVLANDTDPDAGDTKLVTAVRFGTTPGTLGSALAGAHGTLVLNASGAFIYTVDETDAAVQALRQATDTLTEVFNYTMRDGGGSTSSTTLTIAIHGADDAPAASAPIANQTASVGAAFSLALPPGTFVDVDSGDTLTYAATAASGSALPAWIAFNPSTRTFSGTPASGDLGTVSVKVSATDLAGLAASRTFDIVVSTTPAPVSLFTASATPAGSFNDGEPLEVGVKFSSSVAGQITGLKFYRSSNDTGPNLLNLWSASGSLIATASFSNTAATGWQTVTLPAPVAITAGTTYVASYHTTGTYVAQGAAFATPVTSGPLTAPASGNGVFAYGGSNSAGIFPTSSFNATNYFADVVFQP